MSPERILATWGSPVAEALLPSEADQDSVHHSTAVRVATWNLERCPSNRSGLAEAQQHRIDSVGADVWVLTETFVNRSPGPAFSGVFSPPHPTRRSAEAERFVGVWSHWPIEPLNEPAPHRRGSIAAVVTTPAGPLIIYGCVIAYGAERFFDDGLPARPWQVHAAEVQRQASEWRQLHEAYPDVPMVVAGDFNQARSGRPHSYGTSASRSALSAGLLAAGLRSLTDVNLVASGQVSGRSHVDHICVSGDLMAVGDVSAWDRRDEAGAKLSDHPTVAVDLRRP